MHKLRVIEVCAGIGGISLGLEMAGGFETVAFIEIDNYANQVLAKRWPNVPRFRDLRRCSARMLPGCDVLAGGIPCQPHSLAGQRRGAADSRDLWPDFHRLLVSIRPRYAVVENVPGLRSSDTGRFFGRILRDLAAVGYDAEWVDLRASDVGAPHERERVWLVAYPDRSHGTAGLGDFQDGPAALQRDSAGKRYQRWVDAVTAAPGSADGIPDRTHRNRCLGNAVVPDCARVIGDRIVAHARWVGLL